MSTWEQMPTRPRPKSPKPAPFAALRERLGVPDDAPPVPLEPIVGPAVGGCDRFHTEVACPGSFRLVDQDGPVWVAACDECRAETTVSAARMDPELAKQLALERAELPERFAAAKFHETDDNRSALLALRQWFASRSEDQKERVSSLLPAPAVWGLAGRGKSHLLTVVCVRLVGDGGVSVLFRTVRQLLRELQRFEDPVAREQAWHRATTVDVLALDDVGAQQATEWRHDQLADLIDERYAHELPIVLATNYPPQQWEAVMDARTFSRLRGMTFPVELQGADRRLAKPEEREAA